MPAKSSNWRSPLTARPRQWRGCWPTCSRRTIFRPCPSDGCCATRARRSNGRPLAAVADAGSDVLREAADLLVEVALAPEDEGVEPVIGPQATDVVDPLPRRASEETPGPLGRDLVIDIRHPAYVARLAPGSASRLIDGLLARRDFLERQAGDAGQPAVRFAA